MFLCCPSSAIGGPRWHLSGSTSRLMLTALGSSKGVLHAVPLFHSGWRVVWHNPGQGLSTQVSTATNVAKLLVFPKIMLWGPQNTVKTFPEQQPNCNIALNSYQSMFTLPIPVLPYAAIVKRHSETDKYKCAILVSKECSNRKKLLNKIALEFDFT